MAKFKDAWKVASLLLDLNRMWAVVNKQNPITPARIVATLKRIQKFFTGAVLIMFVLGCQSKVNVKVYKHIPEPDVANERSLLVPTQVIFDPPAVAAPPKPERSVLVKPEYDVILHVDEGRTASRGSGTLYRPDAVVTCYHLFADSKSGIDVTFPDGKVVKGKLIEYDKVHDLAVVQIPAVEYRPAKVSESKNLECVFEARGYGKRGEAFRSARGRFVRWDKPTNSPRAAQSTLVIDEAVRSGDSGGGIFNDDGLYGVIWGSADGETYGTSGAGFRQFIKRANSKLDAPVSSKKVPVVKPQVSTFSADRLEVFTDPATCAPCAQLVPVLESLRKQGYNVREQLPTGGRIPRLVFFDGDKEVATEYGFQNEASLKSKLRN